MHFNQFLEIVSIDPAGTLVMRHRPKEKELRPIIARIAQEQSHLFNAFQAIQGERVSKSMRKARYIAPFIAMGGDSAIFVGLYAMNGYATKTRKQLLASADVRALIDLGMREPHRQVTHWHDLVRTDHLAPFRFSLTIRWPGATVAWVRWAHRNVFEILPLPVAEDIRADMPDWDELDLSWGELKNLPPSWGARLAEWRGIYRIFDTTTKQAYVGAAYGKNNLLGRWLNYAKRGHGGNKLLRGRDPSKFRFTILQRVSPDMEASDVQDLEASWKRRLHTREYGLNEN